MKSVRIIRQICIAIGVSVLLTSCSGQVGSEVPSSPDVADPPSPSDGDSGNDIGPLDQFILRISDLQWLPADALNDMGGVAAAMGLREYAEMQTRTSFAAEEFIASCMHDLGFDYTPNPETVKVVESQPGTYIHSDSREWAEQFGFGRSTINALDHVNTEYQIVRSIDTEIQHDQYMRVQQMSEAEREAWEDALNRRPDSYDDWPTTPEEGREKLGCSWLFWFLREQQLEQPEFSGIRALVLEEFPLMLEGDPRIQQLNTDWSRCMVERGYPGWISPSLTSRAFQVMYLSSFDNEPFDVETFVGWDWEAHPEGPPEFDRADLRGQEISTAVASWDCRKQIDYDSNWQRLNNELQQEFVDQHWLDLEEWERAVEAERY